MPNLAHSMCSPFPPPPPLPFPLTESSTDGPELKNILENAKKKAVFIDKNKITIKLTKKVEIKKEIKKFIPKLKNVE
ncbi:conserved Plasmodium protein, unknown function [Plasmodium ovale wallikeri]|uniref:Uncharacterized protein n=1 Tax=Plasmodium ovale wallikeri TaxID=864142 RepID=A0A1A8ZAB8_PLAOA|nr:conserved Plasmodium protein, unknown function [Plasmodium ovale wallikeri]SBT41252.1 conserved Plasmodium protein, unknown function [Plasmodium ovale wallikeri]